MGNHLDQIKEAVIGGKHTDIEDLVKLAIEDNINLNDLINDAMIAAMDVVGMRFAEGEIFVPEMLVSAITMKKGINIIRPFLKEEDTKSKGTIIMCTVKGDLHDIGKNIVIMMLEGTGFKVIDLGTDINVEDLVLRIEEIRPDILGLSALLTTTMPEMNKIIETLESRRLRNSVKVMVGGAPVDSSFAEKIGADGYGKDAAEAVNLARRFVSAR